jgi:hypothetical protein
MALTQKFSWDFEVPQDAFWTSLPFTVGRNFLQCFSPDEIQAMTFDPALSLDGKLTLLLSRAEKKLADQELASQQSSPSVHLYEQDYAQWQKLMLAVVTMHHELGQSVDEERTLGLMLEHPKPGEERNHSALNMTAAFMEKHGRHAEAEQAALLVRPWMEAHPLVGIGSPPAMGNMRTTLRAVWKQGRKEDAQRLYEEMKGLVDGMGETKFSQYQEEERRMLEELMAELEIWKVES